ncbi:hypothetical protein BU24DRAFT_413757 [Aaosphaeria arxii CBS 175.79]|uniref:Uncharacterized protein n=1 Tax=Aaosphaeria arxii CBS 175.79 TaxID=1450172 RepID=A0A6A5XE11_9PLEO|nr:uncharacterized protein BU24DRAFT_413757 [Aaosphaeria arxii CBS 175.79]KAF2011076.1 hypothetical protein BU24DRAFT_413757 [Aaosphaeria arxii CBS 175.79]
MTELQERQELLADVAEWERYQRLRYDEQHWRSLFICIANSDPYPAGPSSHKRGEHTSFQISERWDRIPTSLRYEHILPDGSDYCDSGTCFWMQASHIDDPERIWKVKRTESSLNKERDYERELFKKWYAAKEKLLTSRKDGDSGMDGTLSRQGADREAPLGERGREKNS